MLINIMAGVRSASDLPLQMSQKGLIAATDDPGASTAGVSGEYDRSLCLTVFSSFNSIPIFQNANRLPTQYYISAPPQLLNAEMLCFLFKVSVQASLSLKLFPDWLITKVLFQA